MMSKTTLDAPKKCLKPMNQSNGYIDFQGKNYNKDHPVEEHLIVRRIDDPSLDSAKEGLAPLNGIEILHQQTSTKVPNVAWQ